MEKLGNFVGVEHIYLSKKDMNIINDYFKDMNIKIRTSETNSKYNIITTYLTIPISNSPINVRKSGDIVANLSEIVLEINKEKGCSTYKRLLKDKKPDAISYSLRIKTNGKTRKYRARNWDRLEFGYSYHSKLEDLIEKFRAIYNQNKKLFEFNK